MDRAWMRILSVSVVALVSACGGSEGTTTDAEQKKTKDTASQETDKKAGAAETPSSPNQGEAKAGEGAPAAPASGGADSAGKPPAMAMAAADKGAAAGSGAPASAEKPQEKPAAEKPQEKPAGPGGTCEKGYRSVGDACVCDLQGTFALRERFSAVLSGLPGTERLEDKLDYWLLVHAKYGDAGALTLELETCGQQVPEMCGTGVPPVLPDAEAYGQYFRVWDRNMGKSISVQLDMSSALPKSEFVTPPLGQLVGIALEDSLGAWPADAKAVEGASAMNGARWVDVDGDGVPGVASVSVPPGGVAADPSHGPLTAYAATSTTCPRSDPKAPRSPYAYMPASEGLQLRRLKGYSTGQRIITELHGALESCDRVGGMVTGLKGGSAKIETVFHSCTVAAESGEGSECANDVVSLLQRAADQGLSTNLAGGGTFIMQRIADDATCKSVRETSFD